jgi:hypothetical protein
VLIPLKEGIRGEREGDFMDDFIILFTSVRTDINNNNSP